MTDITNIHGDTNDGSVYTASSLSPIFPDFEMQCKPEPCSNIQNIIGEDALEFVENSMRIPIFVPTIKNPIVLLERCDNIWKTLQLIKVVQTEKPAVMNDNTEEDKKKEVQYSTNKTAQPVSYKRNRSTLRSHNTASVPFKFSVQRTKKVYPCTTCGKQYMEKRSLRKHSERVHGITIPLQRKRGKSTSHLANKKDFNNPVSSLNKESIDFENHNNDDSHGKITAKTKLVNIETAASRSTVLRKFVKCTLCQQNVISLRKHLIHYHKIGGSSSMVEQLESSLLIENGASSKDKNATLENIPSKKSPQSVNNKMDAQDGFRIMDNEADTRRTSQVKKKRKYTLSYTNAKKRRKLNQKKNNECYVFTRHKPIVTQKRTPANGTSYKCDICLGVYASDRSLYKHRRIHTFRGETKENFHNVKCRYHNSPFNKNYKLLQSSTSIHTTANNTSSSFNTNLQLNNSKCETLNHNRKISNRKINQASYNRKMDKNNEFICICGRLFRNPHTLFIHKQGCELFKQENTTSQHATNINDSGSGISITIKKLNNSYEIVGKDNNENKLQKSKIYFKENNLSISNRFDRTKESANLFIKRRKEPDNSGLSNYSKDHSVLKLHVADEDIIIDVEDDTQIELDENNTLKQIIKNNKRYLSEEQNNVQNLRNEQVVDQIRTLKQMCQNVIENNSLTNNQFEDQDIHQEDIKIKSQKIDQENKRKLRSSNKRRQNNETKFDNLNDRAEVDMTKCDPLLCGYCNEQFETISAYHNHLCIVKVGRSFDEFSLELLCIYCDEVLTNFDEYDKHMTVKHFIHAYHCYLCTEQFLNDKARLQHINLEHNSMACRFCNEKISVRVKALHEGYHLGFGYPCHKCKKAYTNQKNLSYHNYKSRLHPKTDHLKTCTICLKTVKTRGLRIHMSTHKHNSCYFCGKLFSNRTGLEFHTMMHHGTQSKLKCNVCDTRFFTKKQLEKHANVDGCNSGIQGLKNGNIAAYY